MKKRKKHTRSQVKAVPKRLKKTVHQETKKSRTWLIFKVIIIILLVLLFVGLLMVVYMLSGFSIHHIHQ